MKSKGFFLLLLFIIGAELGCSAQPNVSRPPRDGVYDHASINEVLPIPYVYLREADLVWTKRIWRELDLREKMNHPFYFPREPKNGWKRFADVVLAGIQAGPITAFAVIDDQFNFPISYEEIMKKTTRSELKHFMRPDSLGNLVPYDTNVIASLNSDDIKWLRIKEDYYFDRQRSEMQVRILGIEFIREAKDDKGNSKGPEALFWIYLPECRDIFARNEIFNLKAGAAGRMTYDDVFMKRMFSSYIIKEENVYDRRIAEYSSQMDALLEAEKAKNSLFEFESNLWEY